MESARNRRRAAEPLFLEIDHREGATQKALTKKQQTHSADKIREEKSEMSTYF
jgi:hypothetical protein